LVFEIYKIRKLYIQNLVFSIEKLTKHYKTKNKLLKRGFKFSFLSMIDYENNGEH